MRHRTGTIYIRVRLPLNKFLIIFIFYLPPPPPKSVEFAAFTIASISSFVMSPTYKLTLDANFKIFDVLLFFDNSG